MLKFTVRTHVGLSGGAITLHSQGISPSPSPYAQQPVATGTRASATEQAVGRLVGAMCAITARDGDAQSAMLASWISQVLHHGLQNEQNEGHGLGFL